MKKKRLKLYHIKRTVWEYYVVEAYSKQGALAKPIGDPFIVDHRNKQIVKDPLE